MGTLELPDGTPESEWQRQLGLYSVNPATIVPISDDVRLGYPLIEKKSAIQVSTSSSTFAVLNGMSMDQLEPGYYEFNFSGGFDTSGVNPNGEFAVYKNDEQLPESVRPIRSTVSLLGLITISANNVAGSGNSRVKVKVGGNDVISVQFRATIGVMFSNTRQFTARRIPAK